MPGFNIHLAIGKRYIEKQNKLKIEENKIKNEKAFYDGLVAPDLVTDKAISHYTTEKDNSDLEKYLAGKVRLDLYLKDNKIETDFEKGVFLHLLTDYLFFNKFFEKEYIRNVKYKDFVRDLYYTYEETNSYLDNKYNIDLSMYGDKLKKNIEKSKKEKKIDEDETSEKKMIFTEENIDKFIEDVSSIDLSKVVVEIKNKQ